MISERLFKCMERKKVKYHDWFRRKNKIYYVDKDISDFFVPLNIPHIIMFQSRYKTNGYFISNNGYVYNLMALISNTIVIMSAYFSTQLDSSKIDVVNVFMDSNLLVLYYSFLSVSFIIMFLANMLNSENNLQLVVKLNEARRYFLNFKPYINPLTNWFLFVVLTSYYLATQVVFMSLHSVYTLFVVDIILIHFDFVLIHAIRCVTLLRYSLDSWMKESKLRNVLTNTDAEDFAVTYYDLKELYEAYCCLADALVAHKKVVAVPVSKHAFSIFHTNFRYNEIFLPKRVAF